MATLLALGLRAAPAHDGPVRIAVLAYQGAEASASDWSHLPAHLDRTVPAYRFELLHLDLAGLRAAVGERKVEFVLTNGGQCTSTWRWRPTWA